MRLLLRNRKKGFTLIELMIVIAIIAILAAILIPNFIRARSQSQLAACESNMKNVATALEMYSTDNNGIYPTGTGTVLPTGTNWSNYMRTNPSCPTNSSQYLYRTTGPSSSTPTNYSIQQNPAATAVHAAVNIAAGYPLYNSAGGLTP